MPDGHSPQPRGRRGSHARPTGAARMLGPSVRRTRISRVRTLTAHIDDYVAARIDPPVHTASGPTTEPDSPAAPAPLRRPQRRISLIVSGLPFFPLLSCVTAFCLRILRPRSIRAKMVGLLLVPIVSVMTLWGLAGVGAAQTVYTLVQLRQLNSAVHVPLDQTISALQAERTAAARFLGSTTNESPATLNSAYSATDTAVVTLQTGAQSAAAAAAGLGVQVSSTIHALLTDIQALPALRGETRARQVTWPTADSGYTAAIADALAAEEALTTVQDAQVASDGQAVLCLARSREMLARQDAVLAAARAGGGLDAAGYREFTGALYGQTAMADAALPGLRASDAVAYRHTAASAEFTRLSRTQQEIAADGPTGPGFTALDDAWNASAAPVLADLGRLVGDAGTAAVAKAEPYSRALSTKAGLAVAAGLIAVLLSLVVSVRIGRGLVVELGGLRDAALDLAARRLPRAVARLRAGQPVDIAAQVPPTPAGSDEISQVGAALAHVHRAALEAAVERAEVVNGVAGVFLNLARRSQILVHRQLALLDTMERRVEDPGELEDLFRLDHLATRMRRHAEGLIILSGAAPGRGWRRPMPLMDVVRAAVAEVEDYPRVDVRRIPDIRVSGSAVADLAHLIAELVENATAFSPPHTRVRVHGQRVPSGYLIEIEDRGLGMGAPALADANRRIASTRQADLLDSDRLGLFVVSRLARRHAVQVSLRNAPSGGTLAVVLLPAAILETAADLAHAAALGSASDSVKSPKRPSLAPEPDRVTVNSVAPTPPPSEAVTFLSSPPAAPASDCPILNASHPDTTTPDTGTPDTGTPDAAIPNAAGAADDPDLPRRVRQASLAAPLLAEPAPTAPRDRDNPAPRSPDQVKSTMSALQSGWSRGRAEQPGRADSPDRRDTPAAAPTAPAPDHAALPHAADD